MMEIRKNLGSCGRRGLLKLAEKAGENSLLVVREVQMRWEETLEGGDNSYSLVVNARKEEG